MNFGCWWTFHSCLQQKFLSNCWLCIFGVNQHVSICDTMPEPCACGAQKHLAGSILCEMDKFPLVMQHMQQHGLALDLELKTLTRVWVLSELDEALQSNGRLDTCFFGSVDEEHLANPTLPLVEDCQASFAADKDLILGIIRSRVGGCEAIRFRACFQAAQGFSLGVVLVTSKNNYSKIKQNNYTELLGHSFIQISSKNGTQTPLDRKSAFFPGFPRGLFFN